MRLKRSDIPTRVITLLITSLGFFILSASAEDALPNGIAGTGSSEIIDRVIRSEKSLVQSLKKMHPVVETYIQEEKSDAERGIRPSVDHYFIGRLDLSEGVQETSYTPVSAFKKRWAKFKLLSWNLSMAGWAQPAIIDYDSFDREHYDFTYVKREFVGDIRCVVFDIRPKADTGTGRFIGRIWVEDEGYHIVRFNGTYGPHPRFKRYVHFDSWRVNPTGDVWIPAVVYAEESALQANFYKKVHFKAQMRYWGYQLHGPLKESEYTNLVVDPESGATDVSDQTLDNSPVASVRLWERQAEDNVLDRLEKGGFLAPKGSVDQILETVVNNLLVTNELNIEPSVRVRILMTTPFESFAVGHTIVISRGLLDVLPDEASLATVLAHELAHVALGHRLDTKFAFTDRLLFDDEATVKNMSFVRSAEEETDADAKAEEFLKKSPYSNKLAETGLFLRQLSSQAEDLPNLIRPLLGNRIADANHKGVRDLRMSGLMEAAPPLREDDIKQVSALPLGSRIKLDPWTNELALTKSRPVPLLTSKEKMPFEVTPFVLHLTRHSQTPPLVTQSVQEK